MSLRNPRELANTQKKLVLLQEQYDALSADPSQTEPVRDLGLRSLKRLINQLKEEIARYETRQQVRQ